MFYAQYAFQYPTLMLMQLICSYWIFKSCTFPVPFASRLWMDPNVCSHARWRMLWCLEQNIFINLPLCSVFSIFFLLILCILHADIYRAFPKGTALLFARTLPYGWWVMNSTRSYFLALFNGCLWAMTEFSWLRFN